jgi:uncharacterized protein (DUF58 family)
MGVDPDDIGDVRIGDVHHRRRTMDRNDFLRKIAVFPLAADILSKDLLQGGFRSIFRGEGMEFDETRQYQQGDDSRYIDRNVSARFGTPYIKLFREERELTVCVVLDCSASMFSGGSGGITRYEQAAMTLALVCFSAEKAGQRVGAVFFDRQITKVFAPKKGRARTMAIISAAIDALPAAEEGSGARGSALSAALSGTMKLLKRRSLVVIISDFLCTGWEHDLTVLREKHDAIAIRIHDPLEASFPNAGLVTISDPETGAQIVVPSGFRAFRDAWSAWHRDRAALWQSICAARKTPYIEIGTGENPVPVLKLFFGGRKHIRQIRGAL